MKNKISKTLYALRAVNKMSSKEVAYKLGISQAQYSKIETGGKEISLQKLEQIATIFNIDLIALLALILKNDLNNSNKMIAEKLQNAPVNNIDQSDPILTLEQIFQPEIVNVYRKFQESQKER